jgi:hypothetical protein
MEKKKKLPKLPYDTDEVLSAFGLERKKETERLRIWLQNSEPIQQKWRDIIEERRLELNDIGDAWNEEELKMRFIAPIFLYAELYKKREYALFYERPLSGDLKGYTISVVCDSLIAKPKGTNTPDIPYFFLQEFKQEKGKYADAEAQMLQAMLLAQAKNANGKPLYGTYIQGKYWVFAILEGTDYGISKGYDATDPDDLQTILSALVRLKTIIEEELAD